jgi:hypothetical protein
MLPSKDGLSCTECQAPCQECVGTADQCTNCDPKSGKSFLYGYRCLTKCPGGYATSAKDGFTCHRIQEDVVPFVFLLIAFVASLSIGVAKVFKKNIHYKNTQIAIITSICLANWLFLMFLTVKEDMWQSSAVLMYGLTSSYILNAIFFCLYLSVMRQDEYYNKWRETRKFWETLLVVCALLSSFQLYRIAFQQLSKVIKLHKEEQAKADPEAATKKSSVPEKLYTFSDENSVKSIFNKLTIVMISCVLFPVLIQNVYNLYYTHPGRQLFWEDCESICITGYLLVMMVFDSYKKTKKIEFHNLKRATAKNDNAVLTVTDNVQDRSGK